MVIPLYLFKNYKKLKLELNEFIFLMYIYGLGNKTLFNPNKFCDDLNLELMEVMNLVSNLTDKGFIKVEVLKNEKGIMEEIIVLDGFFDKLNLIALDGDTTIVEKTIKSDIVLGEMHYLVSVTSNWSNSLGCKKCFPDDPILEFLTCRFWIMEGII